MSGAATGSDDMHDLLLAAGAGVVAYVKNTVTGAVTPPTAATQFTKTAGGTAVTFASKPLNGVTISGAVTFNLWAKESAAQANATVTAELLRLDSAGAVVSVIASCTLARAELTGTIAAQNWNPSVTARTLSQGDRLGIRIYIDDGNGVTMASGRTVTVDIDGGTGAADGDSWVQVTEAVTEAPTNITRTPTLASSTFTGTSTTGVLGAISRTPAQTSGAFATFGPAATLGGLARTPALASGMLTTASPSAQLGAISRTPALASSTFTGISPTPVQGGSDIRTPTMAAAALTTLSPTAQLGSIARTPAPAGAFITALSPTRTLGAAVRTPAIASVAFVALRPSSGEEEAPETPHHGMSTIMGLRAFRICC